MDTQKKESQLKEMASLPKTPNHTELWEHSSKGVQRGGGLHPEHRSCWGGFAIFYTGQALFAKQEMMQAEGEQVILAGAPPQLKVATDPPSAPCATILIENLALIPPLLLDI